MSVAGHAVQVGVVGSNQLGSKKLKHGCTA